MADIPKLNIAIKQLQGDSGIDVWADNLCHGLIQTGHTCTLDLPPGYFQFMPGLLSLQTTSKNYDIIHSSTWNGYAFKDDCPLVITEHHVINDPAFDPYRTFPQALYHRWIHRCERKSLDVADAVTCNCEYTMEKLEQVFGYTNAHLVYAGIDEKMFKPSFTDKMDQGIPAKKHALFFAGNLSPRKGADLLPAIMKNLGDDYVLLVASGQKQGSILGCNNIINLGRLSLEQMVKTYNLCDIFLTPTRLEGFGLSVAEAMACGKPVVATNCSSLPELVVDGKGGFLCEIDTVRDFAEKIALLAGDENLRNRMGMFNRKRVEEKFTIQRMTEGYLKVYRSVI
jgi:glycosyltransferase involved in cell wall biosynthesis